jgi:hypothetical protein
VQPFIGSDAIARGRLTRGQLRWNYRAIHPDVYVERSAPRTLAVEVQAAALWAGAIVTGRAAAALHGVDWIDRGIPVELIGPKRRKRQGVLLRAERIGPDEVVPIGPMRVATPARAGLDIARHLPRNDAVPYLDALCSATGVEVATIAALADRYAAARGVRRARAALTVVDSAAQSPRESWLRLVLIDAGLHGRPARSWFGTALRPPTSTWVGRS